MGAGGGWVVDDLKEGSFACSSMCQWEENQYMRDTKTMLAEDSLDGSSKDAAIASCFVGVDCTHQEH